MSIGSMLILQVLNADIVGSGTTVRTREAA